MMRTFPIGGIHPSDNKKWSKDQGIEVLDLPDEVKIPMIQHIGAPSTPIVKKLAVKLSTGEKTRKVMSFVEPVVLVALLVVVTAFLVDSSSNPFLYFRF